MTTTTTTEGTAKSKENALDKIPEPTRSVVMACLRAMVDAMKDEDPQPIVDAFAAAIGFELLMRVANRTESERDAMLIMARKCMDAMEAFKPLPRDERLIFDEDYEVLVTATLKEMC